MDKLLSKKNWYLIPLAYLIIFFNQYFGSIFLVYAIFLLGILLSLKSHQQGAIYFLIILLLFDDFPFKPKEDQAFNSIYTVNFFGQTLTKLLSLWLFGIAIIQGIRAKKIILGNIFSKIFLTLMGVSIIVGLASLNYKSTVSFINDFRFFFNYIVGFVLVVYLLRINNLFKIILPIMTLVFISKVIVLIGTSVVLANFGTLLTIKTGTGSYLIIFVVSYLIHLLIEKKYSVFALIGLILSLALLVISASRGRLVITGLVIIFYVISTRKTRYLPLIFGVSILLFIGISVINPIMYDYLMWKLTSFIPEKGSGQSSYVRYVELSNILHQNFTSIKSFLFGNGLGGYWDSKYLEYPFDLMNTSSYPEEWILRDKYYKPHGIVQFLLLKVGFLGTIAFYGSLVYLFVNNLLNYKKNKLINNQSTAFVTIIVTGLIPFYLIAFSAKLQLFGGIMVGVYYCYNKALKVD